MKWHPNKEGLLAFGTDDGQVGVYNVISKRCNHVAFALIFNSVRYGNIFAMDLKNFTEHLK